METIKLDQFLDYKFVSGFKANPKRSLAALTVGYADLEKNEYHYDLYLMKDEKFNKLLSLKKDNQFIWKDDQTLLVQMTKNKKEEQRVKDKYTVCYTYDVLNRQLEFAFELPIPGSILQTLNDDQYLISSFLTASEHQLLDSNVDRKDLLKTFKKDSLYEDITEIPFYFNGRGFIANKRNQLFIFDPKTNTIKPVVDKDFKVGQVVVSKDKKHIYLTGNKADDMQKLTDCLYVYHIDEARLDVLYEHQDFSISKVFVLNNQLMVLANDMMAYGLNQNNDFYKVKDGQLVKLHTFGASVGSSVGSDVRLGSNKQSLTIGDHVYLVTTVDDHTNFVQINDTGISETLFEMNGSIDGVELVNDQFYFIGLYKQNLQEVYRLDTHKVKRLSRFNTRVLNQFYVAKPKQLIYKSHHHEVKGFVLYPKDFDESKTYPMILDIHGGPKTVYGKVFYHEMQYWANQGYIVCFSNPRGSDGKGNQFADIRGKYGTIDYEDLMHFTDLVLKKVKQIDHDNMFVTGGSYGGFMTNWIVGHTSRFKAAATQRSIANWLSFHGTSDIGYYFAEDQTAGHPNIDTDLLWQQSPLKYAMHVKTPLLFIHSDMDYRCPIEQAMQFYTVLKEKGLETKFVWFKNETHELSRSGKPQARIKRLEAISDWFLSHKS